MHPVTYPRTGGVVLTEVIEGKLSKDVQYRYDKAGVGTGLVNPEGTVIPHSYDAASRMTKVAHGGNTRAEWLLKSVKSGTGTNGIKLVSNML